MFVVKAEERRMYYITVYKIGLVGHLDKYPSIHHTTCLREFSSTYLNSKYTCLNANKYHDDGRVQHKLSHREAFLSFSVSLNVTKHHIDIASRE